MAKIDKKRAKLQERIEYLETELRDSVTKKTHDSFEINVPTQMEKINKLKIELKNLNI